MSNNTEVEKAANLQELLLDELIDRIKTGKATAADLSVARGLLKDNGITVAHAKKPGSKTEELSELLPFPSPDIVDELKEDAR